jgi:hypothetical protein
LGCRNGRSRLLALLVRTFHWTDPTAVVIFIDDENDQPSSQWTPAIVLLFMTTYLADKEDLGDEIFKLFLFLSNHTDFVEPASFQKLIDALSSPCYEGTFPGSLACLAFINQTTKQVPSCWTNDRIFILALADINWNAFVTFHRVAESRSDDTNIRYRDDMLMLRGARVQTKNGTLEIVCSIGTSKRRTIHNHDSSFHRPFLILILLLAFFFFVFCSLSNLLFLLAVNDASNMQCLFFTFYQSLEEL